MTVARDLDLVTFDLAQDGRVLTAAYHSGSPLNFVTSAMLRDLDRLTRVVDRDPTVGAVVLTGAAAGRFLTHADAGELGAMTELPVPHIPAGVLAPMLRLVNATLAPRAAQAVAERFGPLGTGLVWGRRWKQTILRMNRSRAVYLAAINGPGLGGGHELALACDIRYAAADADVVLGQIEILAGIIPGGGGTQRLPRMIGTARALELILEGAPVTAAEALELGIVNRLVPASRLLAETQATAARLAARSPHAVAAVKRCVYVETDRPLRRGLDRELAEFLSTGTTRYTRRAFAAFADDLRQFGDTPFLAKPGPWIDGTRLGGPRSTGDAAPRRKARR